MGMEQHQMDPQLLGRTSLCISPIGFGAFKIGRNFGIKYPDSYELPNDAATDRLLNGVLDLGINYIDTAPAYGISESRIGTFLAHRNHEFVISTKVGETFINNQSRFDFSRDAILKSLQKSCRNLKRDVLDMIFIHSDGNDIHILQETPVVGVLYEQKAAGNIRAIGFSGKTVEGNRAALEWADVMMIEYNAADVSQAEVIKEAAARNIGIVIKKGLGSGHLPPSEAIEFVFRNEHIDSLVIGGLSLKHIRANIECATSRGGS